MTKAIAEEIADKLTQKLDDRLEAISNELSEIFVSESLKLVPDTVATVFNQYPSWIKSQKSGYMNYAGRYMYISTKTDVPYSGSNLSVKDPIVCSRIETLEGDRIKTKAQKKELCEELVITLLKLSTFKKIEEQFPEAAIYLPESKMEIAINIKDTRDKVNTL